MKRLLLITGVFLIAYVVMMTSVPFEAGEQPVQPAAAMTESVIENAVYLVTERDDRIVVLLNGAEYLRTDTAVSSLPKADQKRLEEGILLTGIDSLKKLLEDYCS